MGRLTIALLCMLISACSSVEMIDGATASAIPEGACKVTVYQTRAQATKNGEIEEMCIINGTSSGSFSHTVATAIAKHKDKACGCGATNVYVESRHESGWDLATVSMVAFRYVQPAAVKTAK